MLDFEYLKTRMDKVNGEDFLIIYPLLEEYTQTLLSISEQSGIKRSDIFIYAGFMNLVLGQMDITVSTRLIEKFTKIPSKKIKSFRSPNTVKWIYTKMARLYYQPLLNSNIGDDEKYAVGEHPCNTLMGYYVCKLFKDTMTYADNREEFESLIREKRIFEFTKGFISIFFCYDNQQLIEDCLEMLKEQNLIDTFTERLNIELTHAGSLLLNYSGKSTKIDGYIQEFSMADDLLEENKQNILKERDQYSKLVQEYEQAIKVKEKILEKYKVQYSTLQLKNAHLKDNPLLKDLSILVIGDTNRKSGYKKLIESYGGYFEFIDGIQDARKARRMALRNDIVFHLTDYSKHIVSKQINDLQHIVLVDRVGVENLEQAILECEDTLLQRHKELE